jgi:hypothetical protein
LALARQAEGIFMAVAAEQTVKVIPELPSDERIRRRAAQFIGAVATEKCVEAPTNVEPIESLYHAIQEAANGNEQARAMIEINVRTDVIERTMKAGHVMSVDLMIDEAGKIRQHGQSLDSVQANSLRFAANSWQMRERVEAETRNNFRIQHHYESGDLNGYYFVVFSQAADNMSKAEMDEAGFFTETMTSAIQLTSVQDGRLVTETAFMAGVERPSTNRYDSEVIEQTAKEFGVDFAGLNVTERLDTPILIPKDMLPDGAINLVQIADSIRGTFFGQNKPQLDYSEYLQVCHDREERFEPKVQEIVDQLISEAELIKDRIEAVRRLDEISGGQMIEQALGDADIDPRVFGPISAVALDRARQAYYEGRLEDAINYVQIAKINDNSNSCPGGPSVQHHQVSKNANLSDECEFISKKCPECGTKNVKTKVTKTRITGSCGCSKSK